MTGRAIVRYYERSNVVPCRVNGAVPTTIIVAGLLLAGYALLTTALNHRIGLRLLVALGVLEILLLVGVGIVVARLADGPHPASVATLIGTCSHAVVPVAAAFWGRWNDTVGPGGHRRGRARRGRAGGPAARELAGDPCLTQRPRRSPRPRRPTRPGRVPNGLPLVAV